MGTGRLTSIIRSLLGSSFTRASTRLRQSSRLLFQDFVTCITTVAKSKEFAPLDHVRHWRRHHFLPTSMARPEFRQNVSRENRQILFLVSANAFNAAIPQQIRIKVPEMRRDLQTFRGDQRLTATGTQRINI